MGEYFNTYSRNFGEGSIHLLINFHKVPIVKPPSMALYREVLEVQQISIVKKNIFIVNDVILVQFDYFF